MSKEIDSFYADIYKLAYISRYAGVQRIKDESVAEHSFFVASLVIRMHQDYNFDLGSALTIAIVHDWAESEIGDVTWLVKHKFPNVRNELHIAEHATIIDKFNFIYNSWVDYQELKSVESKIVALADVVQVSQYAENEIKLGNSCYMAEVLASAKVRTHRLLEELNEFKRQ